ncbi:MAG: winged helix-turn-helix domain-containing protein [Thermoplasmata archaeon]
MEPKPMQRPDPYVVCRFLERLWREGDAMLKTHLQRGVRLNYDLFVKYLEWMLAKGLVRLEHFDEGTEKVRITPKGVEAYERLVRWMRDFVSSSLR